MKLSTLIDQLYKHNQHNRKQGFISAEPMSFIATTAEGNKMYHHTLEAALDQAVDELSFARIQMAKYRELMKFLSQNGFDMIYQAAMRETLENGLRCLSAKDL